MGTFVRTYTTMWCDEPGCNNSFEMETGRAEAIESAFAAGWTGRDIRHFCPDHDEDKN